jgi:hypothetical protein
MAEPLSPAARAVLDATYSRWPRSHDWIAAAVLRAAANRMRSLIGDICHPKYLEGVEASADFLEKIAAELEGANG